MLSGHRQKEVLCIMPPHCDSIDGPVVTAAREALEEEDFEVIVPYVLAEYEADLRDAFELATKAWTQGPEARLVAERYFFETAVRLHRVGEGASFTGLKPAGLDVGPVIPMAERAIDLGSPVELLDFLSEELRVQVVRRVDEVVIRQDQASESVDQARAYVQAVLGLQTWSHKLFKCLRSAGHERTPPTSQEGERHEYRNQT